MLRTTISRPRHFLSHCLTWLLLLASAALSGCVSSAMRPVAPEQASYVPSADSAVVIFLRPSTLGYAIQSSVFDLAPAGDQFVGIVSSTTKVAYVTTPGEHLFMVIGENADFMKATLAPGKTYYALVTPRFGWVKARFSLEPIRATQLDTAEFRSWDDDTEFIENTDASRQWAAENWASIQSKKDDYIRKWNSKPQNERDEQTLNPDDGR